MYCIKCGKKNIPGYAFCYNCGAALVKPEESELTGAESDTEVDVIPPSQETPTSRPENTQPNPSWSGAPPNWPPPGNPYGSTPDQYGAPPPRFDPPAGGPYGTPGPYEPGNRWRPPFPYGYPPFPRRGEVQRFPVAANGKPYIVLDHPEAFLAYKNKDKKQVYAAFATIRARFYAAFIDTFIIYLPLQFLAMIGLVFFDSGLRQRIVEATQSGDQAQANADLSTALPGWVSLAILTVYLLYCVLMTWKAGGQTLGKKILRIKIIRKDGTAPDFNTALVRNLFGYSWGLGTVAVQLDAFWVILGFCLQLMVLIGFSSAFSHPQKRGWHDRLADTYVVGRNELVQGVNY